MNLTAIFGQFAGREVALIEKEYEYKSKHAGTIKVTQLELANPQDQVLEDMKQTASQNSLYLRVWWPGIMGTMDYRTNRVNAHIEKSADGKWRVANRFELG